LITRGSVTSTNTSQPGSLSATVPVILIVSPVE
jgi:hypothetical protein